jgi:hypothetical protein
MLIFGKQWSVDGAGRFPGTRPPGFIYGGSGAWLICSSSYTTTMTTCSKIILLPSPSPSSFFLPLLTLSL